MKSPRKQICGNLSFEITGSTSHDQRSTHGHAHGRWRSMQETRLIHSG